MIHPTGDPDAAKRGSGAVRSDVDRPPRKDRLVGRPADGAIQPERLEDHFFAASASHRLLWGIWGRRRKESNPVRSFQGLFLCLCLD